jgi:hypothetical protein
MAANEYAFLTEWSYKASIEEIAAILEDIESLSTWWPSVYLKVTVLEPGGEKGIGKKVDLLTKGYLPYRLRWHFIVTESDSPRGFTIRADGDFVGRGIWSLRQVGDVAQVTFDWRIVADKPLLRRLSFIMKPVFRWNHHWAMKQGDLALQKEILRRR